MASDQMVYGTRSQRVLTLLLVLLPGSVGKHRPSAKKWRENGHPLHAHGHKHPQPSHRVHHLQHAQRGSRTRVHHIGADDTADREARSHFQDVVQHFRHRPEAVGSELEQSRSTTARRRRRSTSRAQGHERGHEAARKYELPAMEFHGRHSKDLASDTKKVSLNAMQAWKPLTEELKFVTNGLEEFQSEDVASNKQVAVEMEVVLETMEFENLEESIVMIEEEEVFLEESTETIIEIMEVEVVEVVEEVTTVEVHKSHQTQKQLEQQKAELIQLKAEVQSMRAMVMAEQSERKKNTRGINELHIQFTEVKKAIRQMIENVVIQRVSGTLLEATERISTLIQVIYKEAMRGDDGAVCKEKASEMSNALRLALEKEEKDNQKHTQTFQKQFSAVRERMNGATKGPTGTQLVEMTSKLNIAVEQMQTFNTHAASQRTTNIHSLTSVLQHLATLEKAAGVPSSWFFACTTDLEHVRETVLMVRNRVTAQAERQEREMEQLRQSLAGDEERIMDLGREMKGSQTEITRLRELVKSSQKRQENIVDSKMKAVAKKVEMKMEETMRTYIDKRITKSEKSTEKMMTKLKDSVKTSAEKLEQERQARKKTDAKIDGMKSQMKQISEQMQKAASGEEMEALKTKLQNTEDVIKMEAAKRKKAEMEIENLKQLVSSLITRVNADSLQTSALVAESEKDLMLSKGSEAQQTVKKIRQMRSQADASARATQKSIQVFETQLEEEIIIREDEIFVMEELEIVVESVEVIVEETTETRLVTTTSSTTTTTTISPVCAATDDGALSGLFKKLPGEGACADALGSMYDSWFGTTGCIRECKQVCSNSPACVGFDIFNGTLCEARYGDGALPDEPPWPHALGKWTAGVGKGPVQHLLTKGIEDRECFAKVS